MKKDWIMEEDVDLSVYQYVVREKKTVKIGEKFEIEAREGIT